VIGASVICVTVGGEVTISGETSSDSGTAVGVFGTGGLSGMFRSGDVRGTDETGTGSGTVVGVSVICVTVGGEVTISGETSSDSGTILDVSGTCVTMGGDVTVSGETGLEMFIGITGNSGC